MGTRRPPLLGRAAFAALAVVLGGVSASRAAPPALLAAPAAGTPAPEFAQALAPRVFSFPDDHGPHPGFRQEWWYITGNLDAAGGERFGFELTFFRYALAAPSSGAPAGPVVPAARPSLWRAREIYMAHFAVTDTARKTFRFSQKLAREALGLAGAQAAPFAVWIDDWSLRSVEPSVAARPGWRLHAAEEGYELELTLTPLMPPVLNGEAGLSRKSAAPGAASYYYSIPRLAVRGRLLRGGQALSVGGLAWLDREWGSGGISAAQSGWDWFALQLDDGACLMFYALRDSDGHRDRYSAGTWIPAAGEARPLVSADVAIAVTGYWRNPRGVRYPAAWRVRVPAVALSVGVHPVLAAQELTGTPPYWEGAVDVAGVLGEREAGGRGYVELVGYAPER